MLIKLSEIFTFIDTAQRKAVSRVHSATVQSRAAKWGHHHLAITYTAHNRDCTSVDLVVSEMQLNAVRNAKWGQEWSQKGSLSALKSLPFLPLRVFPGGNLE